MLLLQPILTPLPVIKQRLCLVISISKFSCGCVSKVRPECSITNRRPLDKIIGGHALVEEKLEWATLDAGTCMSCTGQLSGASDLIGINSCNYSKTHNHHDSTHRAHGLSFFCEVEVPWNENNHDTVLLEQTASFFLSCYYDIKWDT